MSAVQSHPFQAEVAQVLSLVVNSLYSNKEIFLRELISNASDALDKLRFKAVSDNELLSAGEELRIVLSVDESSGTLTISDNGVGMTEQELIENLGTIARSGTREFSKLVEQAAQAQKSGTNLIGQFGVGFYSAYLVADRVHVVSQAAGSTQAYRWESEAKDTFTVSEATRGARGTTVVLTLKDDQKEYLKPYRIKEVIRRHSDYVSHPIVLSYREKKAGSEDEWESKQETINQANALWQRNPKEVEAEQYDEFYKHLAHDWEKPLSHKHFKVEGTQMFAGIVFLPQTARADLLDPRGEHGVRLHVRRVLAMESCEELLPKWLRFVRGVIDSEDLPLNVSRETLQDSKQVRVIKKQVVGQVLTMIEELVAQRPEDYDRFYKNFGAILKEGLHFEPEHKDRLATLLRFKSTYEAQSSDQEKSDAEQAPRADYVSPWVSLSEYRSRMKPEQEGIYYVDGPSLEVLKQSPHLEQLKRRGFEVLFMTDGVDPFALETLTEFDGKRLINATREGLDLKAEDTETSSEEQAAQSSFTKKMAEMLGERVSDVRVSHRLAQSPACLVTPEGGLPPHLEAMFRAQNLSVPQTKRILEVNPAHPILVNLRKLAASKPDAAELREWGELLVDQALIAEGSQVDDPAKLAARLTSLLSAASGWMVSSVDSSVSVDSNVKA